MAKTYDNKRQGILKHGLVTALIITMSVAVLASTASISTAGAKNTKNSTDTKYSQASKNAKKTRGVDPGSPSWGDICNNYGPPGSINWHGHEKPERCDYDTLNPFIKTIYDL